MKSHPSPDQDPVVQSLWSAIFQGTRLRHVGANDPRVFILKTILWGRQETKVMDVATGEVFRIPWDQLEFVDSIDSNLPGWPPAPKIV